MLKLKSKAVFTSLLAVLTCFLAGNRISDGSPAGLPVFAEADDPYTVYIRDDLPPDGAVCGESVSEKELAGMRLCPGGMPFGVRMTTDGILVVGYTEVDAPDGPVCPAKEAGIAPGDLITQIDGKRAYDAEALRQAAIDSAGSPLTLTVKRDDGSFDATVVPAYSGTDMIFKIGLWVKSRAAGIGTVTFYDPESGSFAGLGHGICDPGTGALLPVASGDVYDVRIDSVQRGRPGVPGELRGYFSSGRIGALLKNTDCGVFGVKTGGFDRTADPLPVAAESEIAEGDAKIICTVSGDRPREYSIKITSVERGGGARCFTVRITDPDLLEATGGIVQGMSGSPVIQNGKLAGALTHVLVDDPTEGYGIFIGYMIAGSGLCGGRGSADKAA